MLMCFTDGKQQAIKVNTDTDTLYVTWYRCLNELILLHFSPLGNLRVSVSEEKWKNVVTFSWMLNSLTDVNS